MTKLAQLILGGRLPAAVITAGLFLVATLLPLLGGLIGLVAAVPAVVIGWHVGGRGVLEVGLLAGALVGLATQSLLLPLFWLAAFWLPVGIAAVMLRRGPVFAQVGLVQTLLVLSGLGIWVLAVEGSPQALVADWVTGVLENWVDSRGLPEDQAQRVMGELHANVIPVLGRFLPGVIGAGVLITWWANLLGGLALAARIGENPDVADSLRAFRLPDASVWPMIALGVVAWLGAGGAIGYWAANGLLAVAMLFLGQGLAVVHSARLAFGWGQGWLVVFYILVGLFVQLTLAVALLGLADVWADFRNKLKGAGSA
ncbi:DUF2232 domain-containing protein [Thiohalorhabdus methylotrophus]|uniref:DUF2232 domain-containing protein n=1 Tax=Thiohalorhabdus methylotrophus TaxID=3242694 RepID=A0ABV4TZ20_9GAMM